jgi:subtilisin family serine protease
MVRLSASYPCFQNVKAIRSFVPKQLACVDPWRHGTYCSSFIVGKEDGPAPEADLYIRKVLDDNNDIQKAWLIEGIRWAIEHDVNIINLSVAVGNTCKHELYHAINDALSKGIIIVCCASNYGQSFLQNIMYPGRIGSVICVGNHDINGLPAPFSSRGWELDFLAPGEDLIVDRIPASRVTKSKGGGRYSIKSILPKYKCVSGTSFATLLVSGLVALLLEYDKNHRNNIKNTEHVRKLLYSMCTHFGYHDEVSGYGILKPTILFGNYEESTIEDIFYAKLN